MIASGALPPHRVALLAPGDRDEWYSASPLLRAARSCATCCRPSARRSPCAAPPVGMGASLGALAMLHAQRRHPGAFGGLFLQSGSFFMPALRRPGARLPALRADRAAFVARDAARAAAARGAVPVVLTCGAAEENVAQQPR